TGKVITHAIYAAGHPPLPSIEVTSFCEEQPQHWLYLRCKDKKAQERLNFDVRRMEQTEQVAVSGLVALTRMMQSIEADATGPKASWQEFARFDCAACHHELEARGGGSWRQNRSRGRAGRPAGHAWPKALVRMGLDAANPKEYRARADQLESLLSEFDSA